MADVKISGLPNATTPVAGTEVLPIVQGGQTRKVSIDNLTAGKSVTANSFIPTSSTVPTNGMFLGAANSVSIATNTTEHWMVNASGNLNPVGAKGIGTTLAPVNGLVSTQLTSTIATGTAPLVVTSTTEVANLRAANATSADTANQVKSNATTGVLQIAGPEAGATRVMTTPNANFTAARTDAAQSFTGLQTLNDGATVAANKPFVVNGSGAAWNFPATNGVSLNTGFGATMLKSVASNGNDNDLYYTAGQHIFGNSVAEYGRFNSSGNLAISNGNLVIGTSGKGIDFSATPDGSGTMTSELFSDYEEGTFTPTLTPETSGSITLLTSQDILSYTKIGRMVYITGLVTVTSVSSPVGNYVTMSLPFTAANLSEFASTTFTNWIFLDVPAYTQTSYVAEINKNTAIAYLGIGASLIGASDQFRFSFSYLAA